MTERIVLEYEDIFTHEIRPAFNQGLEYTNSSMPNVCVWTAPQDWVWHSRAMNKGIHRTAGCQWCHVNSVKHAQMQKYGECD